MDFSKLARDVVAELKAAGIPYRVMAARCNISRQAFDRRLQHNALTTEDLAILASMSVVLIGNGTALINFLETLNTRERRKMNKTFTCFYCGNEFEKEGTWYKWNPVPLDLCVDCLIRVTSHDESFVKKLIKKFELSELKQSEEGEHE